DIAGHGFLLPQDQAGEIIPLSALHGVPHSQPWFQGVANLRGHLPGVVDLALHIGLDRPANRWGVEQGARDGARLVALNVSMQVNAALQIDRLLGLRSPGDMKPGGASPPGAPHFVGQQLRDAQDRTWYELDLSALAADTAFLNIDA